VRGHGRYRTLKPLVSLHWITKTFGRVGLLITAFLFEMKWQKIVTNSVGHYASVSYQACL